jgi:hypothetical protein
MRGEKIAHLDELPDDWTPEDEADLPEELQDWSMFHLVDGRLLLKKPMKKSSVHIRNRRHGRRHR